MKRKITNWKQLEKLMRESQKWNLEPSSVGFNDGKLEFIEFESKLKQSKD